MGFDWSQADWFGLFCSIGCAIHCAATPILLAFLPSIASINLLADPIFHQLAALLCAAALVFSLWPDWRRHRDRVVGSAGLIGVSLLFVAAFVLPDRCCGDAARAMLGTSILSIADLRNGLGDLLSTQVLAAQAWMTPTASVLLVVAHTVNIRRRCCRGDRCTP